MYGLNPSYVLSASSGKLVTSHSLALSPSTLATGTLFHFQVESTDKAGNKAVSQDMTFRTSGYVLGVSVVDQKNNAVDAAQVSVGDVSGITDPSGDVTLKDLPPGPQTLLVSYQGKVTQTKIVINDAGTGAAPQQLTVKIQTSPRDMVALVIGVGGGLTLIGLIMYGIHRARMNAASKNEMKHHFPDLPQGPQGPVAGSGPGTTINPNLSASDTSQSNKLN